LRRITLLRHAKSDWGDPSLRDFDRPLNPRGERNLKLIGSRLHKNGIRPSLIVSSDAVRAITTARAIAQEIGYPCEFIQPVHDLYLATPRTILDIIIHQGTDYNDVMIVGHNPGLTELANMICPAQIDNLPTCGAYAVDIDIDDWADLANTQGSLNYFEYPKKNHPQ
jgi:phosphohistidine phosphatase